MLSSIRESSAATPELDLVALGPIKFPVLLQVVTTWFARWLEVVGSYPTVASGLSFPKCVIKLPYLQHTNKNKFETTLPSAALPGSKRLKCHGKGAKEVINHSDVVNWEVLESRYKWTKLMLDKAPFIVRNLFAVWSITCITHGIHFS